MFVLVRENSDCDYSSVVAVSDSEKKLEDIANAVFGAEIKLYDDLSDEYSIVKKVSNSETVLAAYKDNVRSYLFNSFRILTVEKV